MNCVSLNTVFFSCILFVGCASAPPAATLDAARLGYSCHTYYPKHGMYVSQVSSEQALKLPAWNPKKDLLPLLPHDADQVAWQKLNAMIADGRIPKNEEVFQPGWERERTELVDLGDGLHWVYVVEFNGRCMTGVPPIAQILVTLGGHAVEPQLMYTKKP
jgi:hypothetical protein